MCSSVEVDSFVAAILVWRHCRDCTGVFDSRLQGFRKQLGILSTFPVWDYSTPFPLVSFEGGLF